MSVALALGAPNSAIDTGKITEVAPDFGAGFTGWNRLPDLTARARRPTGSTSGAGVLRQVGYQNTLTPDGNPSGHKTGYGDEPATGTLKVLGKDQLNGGFVWGKAIASYMNDANDGVDLARQLSAETVCRSAGSRTSNHVWSENWTSTTGFSIPRNNTDGPVAATAFRRGSYGNVNLYTPCRTSSPGWSSSGEPSRAEGRRLGHRLPPGLDQGHVLIRFRRRHAAAGETKMLFKAHLPILIAHRDVAAQSVAGARCARSSTSA